MNLTQFSENLLEALRKPIVDPENWMERLENVLYALEHGTQNETQMGWDGRMSWAEMKNEAFTEEVEYSSRDLMNPISHCPPEIKKEKKRLEKEIIHLLDSLESMIHWGQLEDGEDPFPGWPDPLGIFEKCKDFAERIAEEEAPPGISAPPVEGESAEKISGINCVAMHEKPPVVGGLEKAFLMIERFEESQLKLEEELSGENQGKQTGDVVVEQSDEGTGHVSQGCEADKKIDWKRQAAWVILEQVNLMQAGKPVAVTSMSKLADLVGVNKGTVSREINNNPDKFLATVWKAFQLGRMRDRGSIPDGFKDGTGNMDAWYEDEPIDDEEEPIDIENAKE